MGPVATRGLALKSGHGAEIWTLACEDCGEKFRVGPRSVARYCRTCRNRRQREGMAAWWQRERVKDPLRFKRPLCAWRRCQAGPDGGRAEIPPRKTTKRCCWDHYLEDRRELEAKAGRPARRGKRVSVSCTL